MSIERAVELTNALYERRRVLIRLFGQERYDEQVAVAKERVREVMAAENEESAISAAITFCKHLAANNPRADVSTAQHYVLCAGAEMAEDR